VPRLGSQGMTETVPDVGSRTCLDHLGSAWFGTPATEGSYRTQDAQTLPSGDVVSNASVMMDTKMTKTVGEHWVCATLARYDWAPALTRDGLARTDILAVGTLLPDRATVEIQVKTASDRGSNPSWPLGDITQLIAVSEHEWFVLVLLPELPLSPRAFVVPRDHVCAGTWIRHMDWLTDPSVPPGTRNAGLNRARIPLFVWEGYEDCWDQLGKPTSKVKVRLPSKFRELAQEERVGLPPGHPWNDTLPEW
jgi:hypothetical protein